MIVNINYQKRKNQELFKVLEMEEFTFLSNIQNYIPIYNRFFSLNETNYNSINLNHKWYISNIREQIDDNANLYNCTLKNTNTNKTKSKEVFIKMAPLLDPFKFLIGKYDINDSKLYTLPNIDSNNSNTNPKILDHNNSAYVDGFFLYLTSQLNQYTNFIHGVDYYGSFLAIKNNFSLNIFDDLDYLNQSDFFNKNKNVLFKVDDYNFIFENENENNNKLKPIKIDRTNSEISNMSIKSINDDMFDNIFASDEECNHYSLKDLKDMSMELIDVTNIINVNDKTDYFKTTTIKSGSTCSSRTSHTSSENNNIDNNIDNNCNNCNSFDSYEKKNNNEELNEIIDDEFCEEDEVIEAIIPKFPVQVICMENCEDTFDNLILENELTDEEWYSAFMQIIMILLIYQKVFSFTHNDLHTNNIMYNSTDKKFIYYEYKNKYYKVPTFGRIFKIIDFGRSIYKFDGKIFCSNSFQEGGDAATQYNTEPYFNEKKPRLEPNFSFDLCRLACSIFDHVVDDFDCIQNIKNCKPITRLILEWCLDDKGINMLYKNNGVDRYPDFKLYKMIARCVHKHTPQAQLERSEFKKFQISKDKIVKVDEIINIDELPILV